MGLFKPIWMTDKEEKKEKAMVAAGKINNMQKLKEIIVNAPLVEVKCAALQQLDHQPDCIAVFKSAIDEIKDQQILYKLYLFCHNEELFIYEKFTYYIVSKITDQSLLRELLRRRYIKIVYICWYYSDIVIDDQTLLDILTDRNFYYTPDDVFHDVAKNVLGLIEKSMGKEGVIAVAKGTPYRYVASNTVDLIADRGWMKRKDISEDKSFAPYSRYAAADRIADMDTLNELAGDETFPFGLRIDMATDQTLLYRFAMDERISFGLRIKAAAKLTDKSVLHRFAEDESLPLKVRIDAVHYITDQEILKKIILSEEERLSKLPRDASDYREQHDLLRAALSKSEDYELVKRFCTNPGPMGDVHRWEIVSNEESPSYFVGHSRFTKTTRVMRCVCCGYVKTEVYELPASRNEDDTYD